MAEDMLKCRWLRPRFSATIEYLEWTGANHLRHAAFAAMLTNAITPSVQVRKWSSFAIS
jgi:hypothetical protein